MSRLGFAFLVVATVGACDPATLKHTPDAAKQIDGAPDAPAHGPAQVTVYDPSNPAVPVVGVPVVFIEADGTVVGRPVTDTAGIATSSVHANATATAVIPQNGETTMMTVTGVQPGDHIILGNSFSTSSGSAAFTVTYPAYSGATGYYVVGPCGYYGTTALSYAMTVYDYCKQSTMDIVIIAYNSSGPIAYLEKPNVAYVAGGSASVSGTYLLPGTFNASYTNIDASLNTTNSFDYTRYTPAVDGFGTGNTGTPANGMLNLSGQAFNTQSSSVQTRITKGNNVGFVVQGMAGNATSYSMDVGATLLPFVGPVTPDFANHKLAVTVDTTGTSNDPVDLSYLLFSYNRPNGSAGTLQFRWYVLGNQAGDVTLPQLPIEVGDVMPQPTDNYTNVFVVLLESSALTWDMVRSAPFDTISGLQQIDTTTRIRESAYQPRGT